MPLKPGSARATIAKNISEMQKAGHPHDQSVAAAMRSAYGKRNAGKKKKAGKKESKKHEADEC